MKKPRLFFGWISTALGPCLWILDQIGRIETANTFVPPSIVIWLTPTLIAIGLALFVWSDFGSSETRPQLYGPGNVLLTGSRRRRFSLHVIGAILSGLLAAVVIVLVPITLRPPIPQKVHIAASPAARPDGAQSYPSPSARTDTHAFTTPSNQPKHDKAHSPELSPTYLCSSLSPGVMQQLTAMLRTDTGKKVVGIIIPPIASESARQARLSCANKLAAAFKAAGWNPVVRLTGLDEDYGGIVLVHYAPNPPETWPDFSTITRALDRVHVRYRKMGLANQNVYGEGVSTSEPVIYLGEAQ